MSVLLISFSKISSGNFIRKSSDEDRRTDRAKRVEEESAGLRTKCSIPSGLHIEKGGCNAGQTESITRLKRNSCGGCFCDTAPVWASVKKGQNMRICCAQMNVNAESPEGNYARAEVLVRKAARRNPDVIVLPETWNTGFAPKKIDPAAADEDGARTKKLFSALAEEFNVNIVAGSVTNRRPGGVYNTAYVFDRAGACVADYDKTHLFSPAGENEAYRAGEALARFTLDGVSCAVMTCYDLRFPELARALALPGLDVLFIPAQWPKTRVCQMLTLLRARAVENQIYAALCNGCGEAYGVRYGGHSAIVGPLGGTLAAARGRETIVCADADVDKLERIRKETPVWNDRRPELYGELSRARERQ